MNPISLLTKGRTIRALKERHGTYKLLGKSILPNFSGPKNTASATTREELLFEKEEGRRKKEETEKPAPAPAPVRVELSGAGCRAAVPAAGLSGVSPLGRPSERPIAPAGATATPQDLPAKPGLWSRWAGDAVGWVRTWVPTRATHPFQSATVQTELVLDRVKVLRNDLIEDDLEVVMLDSKTGETEKPAQGEKVEREKMTANP